MRNILLHKYRTAISVAVFFSMSIVLVILPETTTAQSLESLDNEIASIVRDVSSAVVSVEARLPLPKRPISPENVNRIGEPVNATIGTGIIMDSLGHILTVLDMVDGFESFYIHLGKQSVKAVLVGVDRSSGLAVLAINRRTPNYLEASPFPPFAGRLSLIYGRTSGNTGYPTLGIIAGRQRDGSFLISGSVPPGLPGGGVFNLQGQLIGVISSGNGGLYDGGSSAGIIIQQSADAYASAYRIICCGNHDAGYLGVRTTAIELVTETGEVLGEAVVISEIEAGSPAATAGLRIGDVITRFASHPVTNDYELHKLAGTAGPDNIVEIEFIRSRDRALVNVTLMAYPADYGLTYDASPASKQFRMSQARQLQKQIELIDDKIRYLQKALDQLLSRSASSR